MNSLRARLIIGAAFIALVPLVLAMVVMSQRLQSSVRLEADARLAALLQPLAAQLADEGARTHEKLELLARDAQLKRLYLVDTGDIAPLREYLATQRFLLGLDYLCVRDTSGRIVADGALAVESGASGARDGLAADELGASAPTSPALASLAGRGALALDGAAAIRYQGADVGSVRGGVALDSLRLAALARESGIELLLRDAGGHVVAATFSGPGAPALPAVAALARVHMGGRAYLAGSTPIALGTAPYASLVGLVPTAAADATIATLRWTALALGALGIAIAILLGWLWSRQVSRPIERLAAFSARISRGEWEEPLRLESFAELNMLVSALERMRSELHDYRDRLRAGERQAAYGQMARKVAHEIKNPLTPIAISVADLRRSYELQRPEFPQVLEQATRTIHEEVERLKRLIQEFSEFGRFPAPRLAPFAAAELLADVRGLYAHELATGTLRLADDAGAARVNADREQLRQALVNLVKNALEAIDAKGHVELGVRANGEHVELSVRDTGAGLSREQLAQLFVPGFTTKEWGSGLGLTIVERIVSDHGGTITADSRPGHGTTFKIRLHRMREA